MNHVRSYATCANTLQAKTEVKPAGKLEIKYLGTAPRPSFPSKFHR